MQDPFIRIALCAGLAAAAGLLSHIFVLRATTPRLTALTGQAMAAPRYSKTINIAAYLTAVLSMLVICTLYYLLAGKLLSGVSLLDAVCFSLIILEIKGNVLRMPFMTWLGMREHGHPAPVRGMFYHMLDQWVSGFALGFVVVALCPVQV